MNVDRRVDTAHHEAGHVVADMILGIEFDYVTIRPRTPEVRGLVRHRRAFPSDEFDVERDFKYLVSVISGQHAGARFRWNLPRRNGDERDIDDFEEANWSDYVDYGEDTNDLRYFSDIMLRYPPDGPDRERCLCAWGEAHELVEQNWTKIEAVAHALLERGTLTRRQVSEVLEARMKVPQARPPAGGRSR